MSFCNNFYHLFIKFSLLKITSTIQKESIVKKKQIKDCSAAFRTTRSPLQESVFDQSVVTLGQQKPQREAEPKRALETLPFREWFALAATEAGTATHSPARETSRYDTSTHTKRVALHIKDTLYSSFKVNMLVPDCRAPSAVPALERSAKALQPHSAHRKRR